ncbi:methylated-DNA--[protein]-cysteine S-methyltransferase [Estrella lausannensis]|nr:methylated-DNA--[protein]-cysteine S-methyltransferase [Estrella lausannensis]
MKSKRLAAQDLKNSAPSREEFEEMLKLWEKKHEQKSKAKALNYTWIESPLGSILAIADEKALYLLEFLDCRGLGWEVERLLINYNAHLAPGLSDPLRLIERELPLYFKGKLREFTTPVNPTGTLFQKRVWGELMKIPYGETRSYAEIAKALGKPTAFRAVAGANGANQLAIIIPCHRVINTGGALGGYSGGLPKKEWLLHLEGRGA